MGVLAKLLIPMALVAVVAVSAIRAQPVHSHAKPAPSRVLQIHQ